MVLPADKYDAKFQAVKKELSCSELYKAEVCNYATNEKDKHIADARLCPKPERQKEIIKNHNIVFCSHQKEIPPLNPLYNTIFGRRNTERGTDYLAQTAASQPGVRDSRRPRAAYSANSTPSTNAATSSAPNGFSNADNHESTSLISRSEDVR
jgi:hypothetical protein